MEDTIASVLSGAERAAIAGADCVEAMRSMPEACVDAVVTDPPYGLAFMRMEWDRLGIKNGAPAEMQEWHLAWAREALRVLKPGGHLLAFGGTRTFHRLACAVEDAGFEIRDCVMWAHGAGFPKSLDVSKRIDEAAGAERKVVGPRSQGDGKPTHKASEKAMTDSAGRSQSGRATHGRATAPATDAARAWSGWGTALKPAQEPVVVARKPLSEPTVSANVLKHGTGALNIDGCRAAYEDTPDPATNPLYRVSRGYKTRVGSDSSGSSWTIKPDGGDVTANPRGRWPANLVLSHLDGCVRTGRRRVRGDASDPQNGRREGGFHGPGSAKGDGKPCGPLYGGPDGTEMVESWRCADGCPVRELDAQSGTTRSPMAGSFNREKTSRGLRGGGYGQEHAGIRERTDLQKTGYADVGGASRFFYTCKAGTDERWFWCGTCKTTACLADPSVAPACPTHGSDASTLDLGPLFGGAEEPACLCPPTPRGAHEGHAFEAHPTVKPVDLMRWLVRLVTPRGGWCSTRSWGAGRRPWRRSGRASGASASRGSPSTRRSRALGSRGNFPEARRGSAEHLSGKEGRDDPLPPGKFPCGGPGRCLEGGQGEAVRQAGGRLRVDRPPDGLSGYPGGIPEDIPGREADRGAKLMANGGQNTRAAKKPIAWTEAMLTELLRRRYSGSAWAFLPKVRNCTGFSKSLRTADALAMSLWPSRGLHIYGFEVKVIRADWFRELNNPAKAEDIFSFCDFWYVVAPPGVVEAEELPKTWCLLEVSGDRLRSVVDAPKLEPAPVDRPFLAAILRKVEENMASEVQLAEAKKLGVAEGIEEGRLRANAQIGNAEERARNAEERIRTFEDVTGLRFDSWRPPCDLAQAIQSVLKGEDKNIVARLKGIRDQIAALLKQCDEGIGRVL